MSITRTGHHTVSSCPYCDRLIAASERDPEEALRALLVNFWEHLKVSPQCKATHASLALDVLGSLAANPKFLAELEALAHPAAGAPAASEHEASNSHGAGDR